ncbi:uncharacterized protein YjdB [Variovorax sp. GrIS 2.14]|uniref:Ig-like domain-containing protein n=1 Tax=Variovorax sp. GrIS 2.14 TaxID=3071709 RepID=UPI0038F79A5E
MATGFQKGFLGYVKGIALAGFVALSGCGGGGSGGGAFLPILPATPNAPTTVTLTAIEINPVNPIVAAGTSSKLAATAIYSDSTHADVTAQVAWASSDATVATVAQTTGLTTGVATGKAMVTASLAGQSGTTSVTVTPAKVVSIAISPGSTAIAAGTQVSAPTRI